MASSFISNCKAPTTPIWLFAWRNILTNLGEPSGTIREILIRIAALPEPDRKDVFTQFLIISGLRRLEGAIEETARIMSLAEIDAMLFEQVFGPKIRAGVEQGRQEGLQEGRYNSVKILVEARFGPLSAALQQHLASLSVSELDALLPRILDASSMAELFSEAEPG